jgi:hypothetical protein
MLFSSLSFVATLVLAASCNAATVRHTLTITSEVGAPNGQPRQVIMTNGQFPGPGLTFDEGDDVEVCACRYFQGLRQLTRDV